MTSKQRVMSALAFQCPDRVPIFDTFRPRWVDAWRRTCVAPENVTPEDHYGIDIRIVVGDESLAPSVAEVLRQDDACTIRRDGWGRILLTKPGRYFYQQVANAVEDARDLDNLSIDPADMGARYGDLDGQFPDLKSRYCVFAKVGGPFIRSCFVRGQVNYLTDMAADPDFAAALTMLVADHLTAIGLEELKRWDLYDTGIWVYDDMGSNEGPMFSPKAADRILVPAWAKMVDTFKRAGATKVILHSDGNIGPLLNRLVDIGFDGIHPVEPRAGLDARELRARFGDKLALIGGLCNSRILPGGDSDQIKRHVLDVLSAGVGGGLVIGTHSIGVDILTDTYEYVQGLLAQYGRYPMELSGLELDDRRRSLPAN